IGGSPAGAAAGPAGCRPGRGGAAPGLAGIGPAAGYRSTMAMMGGTAWRPATQEWGGGLVLGPFFLYRRPGSTRSWATWGSGPESGRCLGGAGWREDDGQARPAH